VNAWTQFQLLALDDMRGVKGLPWAGAPVLLKSIIARRIRTAGVGARVLFMGPVRSGSCHRAGDGLCQKDLASGGWNLLFKMTWVVPRLNPLGQSHI
jgi:hypothetical protein